MEAMKLGLFVPFALILALASVCSNAWCQPSDMERRQLLMLQNESDSARIQHNSFVYWAARGQALALNGHLSEADFCYEQALLTRWDLKYPRWRCHADNYEEAHELVMLLYLKCLNYLREGNSEDALVECRRLDELTKPNINDDSSYELVSRDPLVNFTMALTYEITRNMDDAAISYRKALTLFTHEYQGMLSKHVPNQLINSLDYVNGVRCRTCRPHAHGQLIFIWNNGLSPRQWINGQQLRIRVRSGSWWADDNLVDMYRDCKGDTLLSIYSFRTPTYQMGTLVCNHVAQPMELLEDISWHCVRSLGMRCNLDGLHVWSHGGNWFTAPGDIYYAVVPLSEGSNAFEFKASGDAPPYKESFTIDGDGLPHVYVVTTMAARPVGTFAYDFLHPTPPAFQPPAGKNYGR